MPPISLSLGTLEDLDYGKIDVVFQKHLRRAVQDCLDRPHDKKARVVSLKFELAPDTEQDGDCCYVRMDASVMSKVPAHRTRVFQCAAKRNGDLFFDPLTPDDAGQMTFDQSQDPSGTAPDATTKDGDE